VCLNTSCDFPLRFHGILYNRKSYFAIINIVGCDIFDLVEDFHHQCDGVAEAEAARIDDMVERIRHAAS
jgi:hypothetical protein